MIYLLNWYQLCYIMKIIFFVQSPIWKVHDLHDTKTMLNQRKMFYFVIEFLSCRNFEYLFTEFLYSVLKVKFFFLNYEFCKQVFQTLSSNSPCHFSQQYNLLCFQSFVRVLILLLREAFSACKSPDVSFRRFNHCISLPIKIF